MVLFFLTNAFYALSQEKVLVDYPVIIDDKVLLNPWVGGLNNPQMSKADLDFDGIDELVVFDRTAEKIYVFKHIHDNKYIYDQSLGDNFPDMINFCLIRDYDNDGIPDIFTYSYPDPASGIKAFKGYVNSSGNLAFESLDHNQNNFPNVLHYSTRNNTSNIYLAYTDLPTIIDVDGDGDLDILSFDVIGARLQYYRNNSIEKYGHSDSLEYVLDDNCWGKFLEDSSFDDLFLSDNINHCATYPDGDIAQFRHAGSNTELIDYNKDGLLDLLISDVDVTNVALLLNGGTNKDAWIVDVISDFPKNEPVRMELFPVITSLEIDSNDKKDLIFSPGTTALLKDDIEVAHLYYNIGDEHQDSFVLIQKDFLTNEMIDFGTGSVPAIADVNGDGLWDIVIGIYSSYVPGKFGGRLVLLQNVGSISRPEFVMISNDWLNMNDRYPNSYGFSPFFGDLDNDGDQDMVMGTSDGRVIFFENVAASGKPMNFNEALDWDILLETGSDPIPHLVDIDKDGLIDLLVGSGQGYITYYKNIGTKDKPKFNNDIDNTENERYFSNIDVRTTPGFGNAAPYVLDLKTERLLISGRSDHGLKVYYENEKSVFEEIPHDLNDWNEGRRTAIAMADFNDNGFLDLVVGNRNGGLSMYKTDFPSNGKTFIENKTFDVNILPNPSDEFIRILPQITTGRNEFEYRIISIANTILVKEGIAKWGEKIEIDHLIPGIYIIQIKSGSSVVQKKMVVVR